MVVEVPSASSRFGPKTTAMEVIDGVDLSGLEPITPTSAASE
jgi:hypothetical protein